VSNKFDELAKELAQSVTRRQALKRFSLGLAGMALAALGVAKVEAAKVCVTTLDCGNNELCCGGTCVSITSNNNCGACGNVCSFPTTCKNVAIKGPRGEFRAISCVY
jgi:hypothetical protein